MFDEIHILFHFNNILKHNGISCAKSKVVFFFRHDTYVFFSYSKVRHVLQFLSVTTGGFIFSVFSFWGVKLPETTANIVFNIFFYDTGWSIGMTVNIINPAWLHSMPSHSALHLQLNFRFMKAIWTSCLVSKSDSRGHCFYFALRYSTSTRFSQTERPSFSPLEKMPLLIHHNKINKQLDATITVYW